MAGRRNSAPHHQNPAEANRRWRGRRASQSGSGVRAHRHARLKKEVDWAHVFYTISRRGKARSRYEFGCKVLIATPSPPLLASSSWCTPKAPHGNPYDGHTRPVIADLERATGVAVRRIHGDKGYRGHNYPDHFKVWISGQSPACQQGHPCAVVPPSSPWSAISRTIIGCVQPSRRDATATVSTRYSPLPWLQLQPAPALARAALAHSVADLWRLLSAPQRRLHGRPKTFFTDGSNPSFSTIDPRAAPYLGGCAELLGCKSGNNLPKAVVDR